MSWMPSADPILGDKRSCAAVELVVIPRVRNLGGGFAVRRAMLNEKRQFEPFIFFDQMGPVQSLAGQGMDVRPHPHIGLATVTYLFDGCVMHRDSEGNAMEITPGAMNLMTAGRGIAHLERTPASARQGHDGLLGSRVGGDRLPIWLVGGRPGRSQIQRRIIRRPPMSKPTSPTQMQDLSATLVSLIANIAPSVVSVHSNRSRSTGFAWRPGLIVTADEALSEEGELAVTFGGQTITAQLVGRDPTTDIAVLRVDRSELRPIQLATSVVAPGVLVTAVGAEESTPTAAFGVVSRATGPWRSLRGGEIDARIELDLRLRRTAEGGLVLDMTGQAVGMAVFGPRRRVLVIPSATIERVAPKLESQGRVARGYLGLGLQPVAIDGSDGSGTMVMSVDPHGPGAQAGIHQGDILISWNGEPIPHVQSLLRALGPESVGQTVALALSRTGQTQQVSLTITERAVS